MMKLTCLLAAVLLLATGSRAAEVDEEYFYDEGESEVASTHVPVFSSQPQQLTVRQGENITLPCFMDKATAAILWSHGSQTLYTASLAITRDPRFKLVQEGPKGNSLSVRGVTPSDAGEYTCIVSSTPRISLKHNLDVQYAPVVTTTPERGVLVIKQGSPASMACTATGNPAPSITWTKKSGLLPNGEQKLSGPSLDVAAVDRSHLGSYQCTVDNGVGKPVVKQFRLEVNFAPEIEVMSDKVHTGEGYEAQLICKVHGQPLPTVTWARSDGAALDPGHHRQEHEADAYSVSIDSVKDSDLGTYSCRAKNSLGTAVAAIQVSGKPTEVVVSSEPNGVDRETYTMHWQVESYAPIEEYKVTYEVTQSGSEGEKEERKWEQVIVAAPPADGATSVMYKYTYVLRELQPATIYEATVTARNKYGWSHEPSKPFKLSTYGAESPAADLIGGEALGSKDPNGAATVRTGLLVSLASLLALVAVL